MHNRVDISTTAFRSTGQRFIAISRLRAKNAQYGKTQVGLHTRGALILWYKSILRPFPRVQVGFSYIFTQLECSQPGPDGRENVALFY